MIRDIILSEYKSKDFNIENKFSEYDDGNKFLPLSEKIRMLRSDFPDASIICKVLCDNNVFATVEATVKAGDTTVTAVGKWYHNNQDVYGINYLASAQSNALSAALKLFGYDCGQDIDPPAKMNVGGAIELLPPPDSIYQTHINEGKVETLIDDQKIDNDISFEQARNVVINNPPFCGKTIGEIIDNNYEMDTFIDLLNCFISNDCALSPVAKVVINAIN